MIDLFLYYILITSQEPPGHLHHFVDVPHGVDQIGRVFVQFALDEKLYEISDEGRVDGTSFPVLRPYFRRLFIAFVLEKFLVEKFGSRLRNLFL